MRFEAIDYCRPVVAVPVLKSRTRDLGIKLLLEH